jgi:hypothetical protein
MRPCFTLSLLACGAPVLLGAQNVRVNMEPWREPILMDTLRQNHDLDIPPAKVYEATLKAFAALDVPVGNTAGNLGIIASERFTRFHVFAGEVLSRSFDCGEGPTGKFADSYRVEIAVVAYIEPRAGGGTRLGLASIASGRDPTGPYRYPKECASTGRLELRLLNRVKALATE